MYYCAVKYCIKNGIPPIKRIANLRNIITYTYHQTYPRNCDHGKWNYGSISHYTPRYQQSDKKARSHGALLEIVPKKFRTSAVFSLLKPYEKIKATSEAFGHWQPWYTEQSVVRGKNEFMLYTLKQLYVCGAFFKRIISSYTCMP